MLTLEEKKMYSPILGLMETEEAIETVKSFFTKQLCEVLDLKKVSAPVFVMAGTGLNDDLNGIERPVAFPVKHFGDKKAEIVHSLAKWKRLRLHQLQVPEGKGIVTDMRALRPDEELTDIHSVYVDQWDWEKHIDRSKRSISFLKESVISIYSAIKATEEHLYGIYPELGCILPEEITFISAKSLQELYPSLTIKERENKAAEMFGAVFIMGIGGELGFGEAHDGRAPDYDDWSTVNEEGFEGLNGDIVVWHPVLKRAFELSSMGIRVDKAALDRQLKIRDCEERAEFDFHKMLLSETLPQSMGGGIGQSRFAMFLLRKAHIGEVQVSVWPEEMMKTYSSIL